MSDKSYKVYPSRRRAGRKWAYGIVGSILGLVLIVGGVASGYALWLDAKVSAANDRVSEELRRALADDTTSAGPQNGVTVSTVPESPGAMNILLLGSDTRSDIVEGSRSDTVILVHVDPANNYLSMLSFPRDLRVEIEGYGTHKLNWAFAEEGPELTIEVVQQITGVDIDHYLEVPLQTFIDMTYRLGGVYVEVDRRYYNNNELWEKIDLQPGYQLLGGNDALDFCRFRHDRNADFGRMERQQRFLSGLRQQAKGWDLGFKLPGLVGAFFDNVITDMTTNDFIELAWWGVGMDGERIRQVSLRGMSKLSSGVTLVFWEPEDMAEAVQALLTPPGAAPVVSEVLEPELVTTTTTTVAPPVLPVGATPDSIPNATIWRKVAEAASFAVQAPAYVPEDFRISTRSKTYARFYDIDTGGGLQPALVMLYQNRRAGEAGEVKLQEEFINITQTTWLDAPAASPGRQVTYNGTVFTVVGSAGRVERIWWKSDGVLYWVSNTLARVASEAELLAMAESMILIPAQ